jgi:hypothetical protein
VPSPLLAQRHQLLLGDDVFVNDIKDTHVNCRLRPPAPCPKSP